ncbi:DNA/RNA helicase domain-containing protein [Bacillus altitudinis]|uniref:DNA/RNA helicase domain-containing protein n=1 Tax=Bacillus altitudinis TaxID=293387 RepID=UPI0015F17D9E|nr:DNA/RNA helicase domain-containing protein [Bacillus altitudinis]
MRPVNLLSVTSSKIDFKDDHFWGLYLNNFGIDIESIKEADFNALLKFVKSMSNKVTLGNLEHYFWGYKIPQISKEFDLLRIGAKTVINIELKLQNTGDKMKEQLIQNRYYLRFLERDIISYTYEASEGKIFKLTDTEAFVEVNVEDLKLELDKQDKCKKFFVGDINTIFNPSDYLVSPFNSTERFLNNEYFLTDHQIEIKKRVIESYFKDSFKFLSIQGGAGSGKTLLGYDIIKQLKDEGVSVLIIHCGRLNEGHKILIEEGWSIISIAKLQECKLDCYDLILFDESQRVIQEHFDLIVEHIKKEESKSKIIFSFDKEQCLASFEIERNIPGQIENLVCEDNSYKLTTRIRTNKELSSFIQSLFKQSFKTKQKYSNIDIQYFSNAGLAKKYLDHLYYNTNWTVINFTQSKIDKYPYNEFLLDQVSNSHSVLGQEFDNVAAVIDEYYYYNAKGKLTTGGYKKNPYYHPTKMLYQNVSRARNKLKLIIIKNEEILKYCLKTLNNE